MDDAVLIRNSTPGVAAANIAAMAPAAPSQA